MHGLSILYQTLQQYVGKYMSAFIFFIVVFFKYIAML